MKLTTEPKLQGGGVGPDPAPPTWVESNQNSRGWRQLNVFQAAQVCCSVSCGLGLGL